MRPPDLPGVFDGVDLAAAGVGRTRRERALREGSWVPLARGTWCTRATWDAADRRARVLLGAMALQRTRPRAVASHLTAVAVWGLPLPLLERGRAPADAPETVQLTADPSTGAVPHRGRGVHLRVARLAEEDVAVRQGLRITGRARTVVDCLRTLPAQDAVAVADAAAADGLRRAEVDAQLLRCAGWPGSVRARGAVDLVDPRRESWLESVSAVRLRVAGVEPPETQVTVWDADGRFVARVDLLWPARGVVGEADGLAKYRLRGLRDARDVERELHLERRREHALRELGYAVVRWTTAELLDGDVVPRRVAAALARTSTPHLLGHLTQARPIGGW